MCHMEMYKMSKLGVISSENKIRDKNQETDITYKYFMEQRIQWNFPFKMTNTNFIRNIDGKSNEQKTVGSMQPAKTSTQRNKTYSSTHLNAPINIKL